MLPSLMSVEERVTAPVRPATVVTGAVVWVTHERVPPPFVDRKVPGFPSVAGSVQTLLVRTESGDLKPT